MTEADREHYVDPRAFAREVNLPLLGEVDLPPLPPGAGLAEILKSPVPSEVVPVVDSLAQTRQSLTLRSLLLAGYAHDPELFSLGLAIAREWGRRGLRVALVDLNFWSPSVTRPPEEPSEGLVDMLEFGCSFRRVAWEVVADRLWIVIPGSYLPDAERILEHADWDRVSRVLAGSVDVAVYVGPLLERSGYLGRLSKRMDGVILGGSVERVTRARLRDAFLELWGSDAPMIGCVGIRPVAAPEAGAAPAAAVPVAAALPTAAPAASAPAASAIASAPAPAAAAFPAPASRSAPPASAAPGERIRPARAGKEPEADESLVETLTREAMAGSSLPAPRRGGRLARWLTAVAVVAIAGGAATTAYLLGPLGRGGPPLREAPPTGTDQVLPAGLGAPVGGGSPGTGDSLSAPGSAAPGEEDLPYRVHVASFRSEDTVRGIADDLTARGLDAWYEPAPDRAGWYRVFVGRFATYEEAAAEAESLLNRGLVERAQAFPDRSR